MIVALLIATLCVAQEQHKELTISDNEFWWGGCVTDGELMPFGQKNFSRDLYAGTHGNQAQPLLLSSQGRYVWSEEPFAFTIQDSKLIVESRDGDIIIGQQGYSLRDAFRFVAQNYFPSTGTIPEPLLFTRPQYNTWIELMYDQREDRVRKYANDILTNGFPPGVIMIDDNWQEDYGSWEFHPGRFHNPKGMIDSLHVMGFKVMLWVCPFVSPDSFHCRTLAQQNYLLKDEAGGIFMCPWWNGTSAVWDFTNPKACESFTQSLRELVNKYGVDGFKFDGGDSEFYDGRFRSLRSVTPNQHSELWAHIGLSFPLNEYRACWKLAGQPLAQRLRDKRHDWEDLRKLVPHALALGLMGYTYLCPDLIGGGEYTSFLDGAEVDEELVVRYAQCSALMPMMQFSVAPWRVLNQQYLGICRDMARLHQKMGDHILALARTSSQTGEPMVRALEYAWPHQGYEQIKDQFLLGEDILVAPVVEKGKRSRTVVFPPGQWTGEDGTSVQGPCKQEIQVPIERLPWYRLTSLSAMECYSKGRIVHL